MFDTTGRDVILTVVKDQRIAKWTRWIEGRIRSDVLTMHLQRAAWRDVSEIIQDHGELPDSYWWEFMVDTYAVTQAVAVRRQADLHKGVVSLAQLIDEIRQDPTKITREFWIGLWDTDDTWFAEHQWSEQFGGSDGLHLDQAVPVADAAALKTAASKVKGYVDQHLAHADAVPASVTLEVRDIHAAIDVIGELFRKYVGLLTATSYVDLVPAIQHDWKAAFREPWMRPAEH